MSSFALADTSLYRCAKHWHLTRPVGLRRADRKHVLREFRGMEVQALQQEIDAGLRVHPNVPQLLKDWLWKEAVHSAARL